MLVDLKTPYDINFVDMQKPDADPPDIGMYQGYAALPGETDETIRAAFGRKHGYPAARCWRVGPIWLAGPLREEAADV